jgi:2-C-methyl-D-erythritol 4-phosphate cytidylyltransferase
VLEDLPTVSQDQVVAVVPIRSEDSAATLTIAGRSVLDGTVRALRAVPQIGPIVLALEGIEKAECLAAIEKPEELGISVAVSAGNRWQTIDAALAIGGEAEVVLLHDPDRPLVSAPAVTELLAWSRELSAAVTAMPVHSSIKRVVDGQIVATVPRELLHEAQSPWVFRRETLAAALRLAIERGWPSGDELDLVRAAGIPVHIAEGHRFNVPIVSLADARFAEMAAGHRFVSIPGRVISPA